MAYSYPKILEKPWDHSPITVYIDNKNVPPHYSESYYQEAKKALEYWEKGGNGKLDFKPDFKIVEDENTDIRIGWVENLESVQGTPAGVAGYAKPYIKDRRFTRVDIVLEVGNYKKKAWVQYGDATMRNITKHELGHALGLAHSDDRRDIMYEKYEMGDNINPLLVKKYGPLLKAGAFISAAVLLLLGGSWYSSRKKRKELEKKYLR